MGDLYNRSGGKLVVTDLEVDSGTLSIDEVNNRVGIGTTLPATTLDVSGVATVNSLSSTTTAVVGTDLTVTGGDIELGNGQNGTLSVAAVSGTDIAGKALTISGGEATGNATPGAVTMQVSTPGASGAAVQTLATIVELTASGPSSYWAGVTSLVTNTGVGDIVSFGAEDGTEVLLAGKLMYLDTAGVWKYADADAVATGGSELLGIALGTTVAQGLLVRGFFNAGTIEGSFVQGGPAYVSEVAGTIDFTAPSASGDFVRVIGQGTNTANIIYFAPSLDNIVIA